MNRFWLTMILALTLSVSGLYGAELAYEGFDYGTSGLSDGNGGTGFSSAWVTSGWETVGESLPTPKGYGFFPGGGRVQANMSGVNAYRDFAFTIDMDPATETTYYFSMLFQRNDANVTGSSESVRMFRLRDAAGLDIVKFEIGGAGNLQAAIESVGDISGTMASANIPYLIVGKLITRSGADDEAFAQLYGPSGGDMTSEPTTWQAEIAASSSTIITNMRMSFDSNSDLVMLDELRIATSWDEVVRPAYPTLPVTDALIVHLSGDALELGEDPADPCVLRVIQMLDQSGYDNHAAQPYGNLWMPIYVPADETGMGYPAVRFGTVAEDYLEISGDTPEGATDPNQWVASEWDSDDFSWFVVVKAASVDTSGYFLESHYSNSQYAMWGNWIQTMETADNFYRMWGRGKDGKQKSPYSSAAAVTTNWCIIESEISRGNSARIWIDGSTASYRAKGLISPDEFADCRGFVRSLIGREGEFDLAEVMIFKRELWADETAAVGSYLADKYGITLPEQHVFTQYMAVNPADCAEMFAYGKSLPEDLIGDCVIDLLDLQVFASRWLTE